MTDRELIQALAEQVMGWADMPVGWNPLSNWNDTMRVDAAMKERKFWLELTRLRAETVAYYHSYDQIQQHEHISRAHSEQGQRAICEAAYKAVTLQISKERETLCQENP